MCFFSITADCTTKEWRIDQFCGNTKTPKQLLAIEDERLKANKFYRVEVQRRGNVLLVLVDGESIFKTALNVDDGALCGHVGIMCLRSKAVFKDVSLTIDNHEGVSTYSEELTLPPVKHGNWEMETKPVQSKPVPVPSRSKRNERSSTRSHLKESILHDLLEKIPNTKWDDVVGLENAKRALKEAVILPALRPDLFNGLRKPPRGVLLFGPPGTGKTMLAKCVASASKAKFFCISASSVTSKFHGEGEKLVRTLFETAREMQPSVVFIDEIDSLLSARKSNEHDAMRRIKTEFLVQLDGVRSNSNGTDDLEKVLIMGATNRPGDLDDAILRRMEKRIYIPLPNSEERVTLIRKHQQAQGFDLSEEDMIVFGRRTEGFSCSDLVSLCREASFGPLRDLGDELLTTKASDMRAVNSKDFEVALENIRSSVSKDSIESFEKFKAEYGS
jgi:spastin